MNSECTLCYGTNCNCTRLPDEALTWYFQVDAKHTRDVPRKVLSVQSYFFGTSLGIIPGNAKFCFVFARWYLFDDGSPGVEYFLIFVRALRIGQEIPRDLPSKYQVHAKLLSLMQRRVGNYQVHA